MSNLESVQGLYEAFAKGDVPTMLGFLDANIAWTEAEGFPYGGTYDGPNAVLEGVFMRLGSEWDGFAAVPDEFIDAGDTIVVLGSVQRHLQSYPQELQGKLRARLEDSRGQGRTFCAVRGHIPGAASFTGIRTIDLRQLLHCLAFNSP
jgi:hypothetical protein